MAQTSGNALEGDFLGGGQTTYTGASDVQAPNVRPRATDPTGLYYLDTGEPTPLWYARYRSSTGQVKTTDPNYGAFENTVFNPSRARENAIANGSKDPLEYKFDSERGLYYAVGPDGDPMFYINNDPAAAWDAAQQPLFTVEELSSRQQQGGAMATAAGAAQGAALGSALGPYGAVVGGVAGAMSGLPQAGGKQLQLGAGAPLAGFPNQRIGTQAEANQGNANLAATGSTTPAGGWPAPVSLRAPMATYTPSMGTNGQSALSQSTQRILSQADRFGTQNEAAAARAGAQVPTYANRAAPQITAPSSANQQAVYDRAMGFQADVSGAERLENMQFDMQGINNLESWSPQYSMQGVQNLESFNASNTLAGAAQLRNYRPDATYSSANELRNWVASHTSQGAEAVRNFRPSDQTMADAQALREFRADRTGIDRLNAYADAPEGPSQAQALLRAQSDQDKRTMLALARSGRGGPAAQVQGMRQAMSEGSLIASETRGQSAALRAAETAAYEGRKLQALAQAGSLISQSEAQRLTALAQAGQMMSTADQQKLAALQAYGQLKAQQDAMQLSAKQAAGQLNLGADTNVLNAQTNSAQLMGQADSQILNARTNAAQLRSTMDAQGLSAISTAAGLRGQNDQIRSSNLQAAGNIRLQGSGLNLQALSLAGQVASDIRNQDIQVLRSNLDSQLQTLGLNDNQVRFFSQMQNDREMANQNLQMQASGLGLNAAQLQAALDLQWQQFAQQQLTDQQRLQLQYDQMAQGGQQFNQQMAAQQQQYEDAQRRAQQQSLFSGIGSGLIALSNLFGGSGVSTTQSVAQRANANAGVPMNMDGQPTAGAGLGYNSMGMVWDPFTGQYVYPNAA